MRLEVQAAVAFQSGRCEQSHQGLLRELEASYRRAIALAPTAGAGEGETDSLCRPVLVTSPPLPPQGRGSRCVLLHSAQMTQTKEKDRALL